MQYVVNNTARFTTQNAEKHVHVREETGQIAPGMKADLALFDIEDIRELPYWYGDRRCHATWVDGRPAWTPGSVS
jgi:imidazolonepropionase